MKLKIYQQRNTEIQSKTYISADVFFLLTCDQAFCLFSVLASVHGGLDPIAIQSNHLLGNPQDTLTERLLTCTYLTTLVLEVFLYFSPHESRDSRSPLLSSHAEKNKEKPLGPG